MMLSAQQVGSVQLFSRRQQEQRAGAPDAPSSMAQALLPAGPTVEATPDGIDVVFGAKGAAQASLARLRRSRAS
jgi:hypothetical protein